MNTAMDYQNLSTEQLCSLLLDRDQTVQRQQQIIQTKERLLTTKEDLLAAKDTLIGKKDRIIDAKDRIIKAMEESLRLQKLRRFGASSEKSVDQQELFNEAELEVVAEEGLAELDDAVATDSTDDSTPSSSARTNTSRPRGRKPLPADLPRVRIEHPLPDVELSCSCGCTREVIGEETSEQLDIIPAQIRVLVHVRPKVACKACESGVVTASLPAQPIPRSNASPGLLAYIATAKYQDALPLYRQEAILARQGIEIPRNTLAGWMVKAGELLQPLMNLLEERLLSYPVLHCDETPVQVLNEQGKRAQSTSYMWVRVGGPPTQPIRLFHYAQSRSGEVARQLLNGFEGYVQTDDYAGYNGACAQHTITQLGCWAHARRKFVEAKKVAAGTKNSKANRTSKTNKANKTGKADMALAMIGKLYAIERSLTHSTTDERYQTRQQQAVPQLKVLKAWLNKTQQTTLPKGALGKALAYLNKNWDKLSVYTTDGRLNIDNNPAENAIRPFVIGRKNWLFSVSVPGAKASANLYSLIETAKANGLEPYAYLKKVFTDLPKASSLEDIEQLLPIKQQPVDNAAEQEK